MLGMFRTVNVSATSADVACVPVPLPYDEESQWIANLFNGAPIPVVRFRKEVEPWRWIVLLLQRISGVEGSRAFA